MDLGMQALPRKGESTKAWLARQDRLVYERAMRGAYRKDYNTSVTNGPPSLENEHELELVMTIDGEEFPFDATKDFGLEKPRYVTGCGGEGVRFYLVEELVKDFVFIATEDFKRYNLCYIADGTPYDMSLPKGTRKKIREGWVELNKEFPDVPWMDGDPRKVATYPGLSQYVLAQ